MRVKMRRNQQSGSFFAASKPHLAGKCNANRITGLANGKIKKAMSKVQVIVISEGIESE